MAEPTDAQIEDSMSELDKLIRGAVAHREYLRKSRTSIDGQLRDVEARYQASVDARRALELKYAGLSAVKKQA